MKFPQRVYAIKHRTTGKIYVGRSSRPKARIKRHLCNLRGGRHPVEDMQADYDKYGEHYSFYLLDFIRTWGERNKEFQWQLKLNSLYRDYGYNYKDPVANWCTKD